MYIYIYIYIYRTREVDPGVRPVQPDAGKVEQVGHLDIT